MAGEPIILNGDILLNSGDWTVDNDCCCDPPYCFCNLPNTFENACHRCYATDYVATASNRLKIAKVTLSGAANPTPNNPYPLGFYSKDSDPWLIPNSTCGPRDSEHASFYNRTLYFDICNNGYPYSFGQYESGCVMWDLCAGEGCGQGQPNETGLYPCRPGDPNICSVLPVSPGIYTPFLSNLFVLELGQLSVRCWFNTPAFVFDGTLSMWLYYHRISLAVNVTNCMGRRSDNTCPPPGALQSGTPDGSNSCNGFGLDSKCPSLGRNYWNKRAYTSKAKSILKHYLFRPSIQWNYQEHIVGDPGTFPFTYCNDECNGITQKNGCFDATPTADSATSTTSSGSLVEPGYFGETFLGMDFSSFDANLEMT